MHPLPAYLLEFALRSHNSVLLLTSRPDRSNYRSYVFVDPTQLLIAEELDEIPTLFHEIERHLQNGYYVAGYLTYECGHHFQPTARPPAKLHGSTPLAWFGVYHDRFVFDHRTGTTTPPLWRDHSSNSENAEMQLGISGLKLDVTPDVYYRKVKRIREYIAAGDTYQVNFTTSAHFDFVGSVEKLFRSLEEKQRTPYSVLIHTSENFILSFSPELFFRVLGDEITIRPMKGTAARGNTPEEDDQLSRWLHQDPKNRSENVMIVDLMRSDLGKIAVVGSIKVEELFSIETYDTLFQMTSTVSARIREGTSWYEIFEALFPSGSVTGAPKRRTMEIIEELEGAPRCIYTGAIGYLAPNGEAVFNVPIRTVVLAGRKGHMGVGSGITYDSVPEQEYEECLLKMKFLTQQRPAFQLLESLCWSGKYHFLEEHLHRLECSARYFSFAFDRDRSLSALRLYTAQLAAGESYKIRIRVDFGGEVAVDSVKIDPSQATVGAVTISEVRTSSRNQYLKHKTTNRELYDRLYREARSRGEDDVLFFNEHGELTEGAIHNIFLEIEGGLFTPPIKCGLLAGIYRQYVLQTNPAASERIVREEDVRRAERIYLCNSVRGMRQVRLIDRSGRDVPPEKD